ncbi:MAG: hypothetical protein Ct9H300mP9_4190 [Candidatus Neomarinimicrobiota bacterium]|nr:MAG: hypothetical protein Ct9H300mP9_4190 [Candidatus Neomarinimicrobiota bacterium]
MEDEISSNYSKWIFSQVYENYNTAILDKNKESTDTTFNDTLVDGWHVPQAYKTRFTLDLVSGNLQINNVFGATGMTYFAFSDILGDHQIAIGTEMVLTLENSDYYFYYGYLKNQTDYHFVGFQNANFFQFGFYYTLGRLRHRGFQTSVSHPFSRFQGVDVGFSWHNVGV